MNNEDISYLLPCLPQSATLFSTSPTAPSGRVTALRCGGVTLAPFNQKDQESDAYVPVNDDHKGYNGYVIDEEVGEVIDDLVEDDL